MEKCVPGHHDAFASVSTVNLEQFLTSIPVTCHRFPAPPLSLLVIERDSSGETVTKLNGIDIMMQNCRSRMNACADFSSAAVCWLAPDAPSLRLEVTVQESKPKGREQGDMEL